MINPHNVLQVLSNLISDKLSSNPPPSISFDEEQIAFELYKCLNSIMESTSRIFETEAILDHDNELEDEDLEHLLPLTSTHDHLMIQPKMLIMNLSMNIFT
jgi:hypothetical protein